MTRPYPYFITDQGRAETRCSTELAAWRKAKRKYMRHKYHGNPMRGVGGIPLISLLWRTMHEAYNRLEQAYLTGAER